MNTKVNVDITKTNRVTNFGIQSKQPHSIYLRLHDNKYVLDNNNIQNIRLTIRVDAKNEIDIITLDSTNLKEIDGEYLYEFNVPNSLLELQGKLFITIRVRYNNINYTLNEFKILVFEKLDTGMFAINNAVNRFNYMINLYLDSIKRDQIDVPNGVVALDSEGRFDEKFLPDFLKEHIEHKLWDTHQKNIEYIHGLRLDTDTYRLHYYDDDDDADYLINQIHGGLLGHPNKSSEWNIFGGNLSDVRDNFIDANVFTSTVEATINAGTLDTDITNTIDGGKFMDSPNSESENRVTNPIHGGFI